MTAKKFTESELLALMRQKNENVISHLYDTYAPLIYGLIIKELKNEQLSSRILQSAFIRIAKECFNVECIKQSLFVWMWTMTQKTAFSHFNVGLNLTALKNSNTDTNYSTFISDNSRATNNSSLAF